MSAREKPRQNLGDDGMEDLLQKKMLDLARFEHEKPRLWQPYAPPQKTGALTGNTENRHHL